MKRATSLLALILLLGSGFGSDVSEESDRLECYSGVDDGSVIESGFDYCLKSIEFVARNVLYSGVVGSTHPFDNTTEIDMAEGPCFIQYTKNNVFTYCYCQTDLCHVPPKPRYYDRLKARLNLEALGGSLDYGTD